MLHRTREAQPAGHENCETLGEWVQGGPTVKKAGIRSNRLNFLAFLGALGRRAGLNFLKIASALRAGPMFPHPNFARPAHFPPPGAALRDAPGAQRVRKSRIMRHGVCLNGTSHQPLLAVSMASAPSSTRAITLMPLYPTRHVALARPERVERRVMRLLRGHPDPSS